MAENQLSTSVLIVTGAASGIGRELALQAADLGAYVIAVDINSAGLDETAAMVAKHGGIIQTHVVDVADKEAIVRFADTVLPMLDRRKLVLINNAGVALNSGNFNDTGLEDIEWLFNINFWAAVRLTKAFYPYFMERGEGHIVNVSSVFGLAGVAYQTAYCPAKFALRGFTETLRMELSGAQIETLSVHPGGIRTNITRSARVTDKMNPTQQAVSDRFDAKVRTSPQKAARKIIQAIQKRKKRLLIGPDAVLLDWVVRLFPVWYTKLVKGEIENTFNDPYRLLGEKK